MTEVERGRVGTRRAAELYGVPRSTLRNKVGKLSRKSPLRTSQPCDFATEEVQPATKRDLTCALKRIISRHLSEKQDKAAPVDAHVQERDERRRSMSRNKRGRYRKYDQNDLEEALQMIKDGGQFYTSVTAKQTYYAMN